MLEDGSKLFLESLRRFKSLDPLKEFLPISHRDFMVLTLIQEYSQQNKRVCPSDLSQWLDLTLPATSDMLKRQMERGWLIKKIDQQDRRSYYVELSEEGAAVYLEGKAVLDRFLKGIIERYGQENMARLLNVMDDIYQLMEKTKQEMLEEKNA